MKLTLFFFLFPVFVIAAKTYSMNENEAESYVSYMATKRVSTPTAVASFFSKHGSLSDPNQVKTMTDVPTSALLSFIGEIAPTSILTGKGSPYNIYNQLFNGASGRIVFPAVFVVALSVLLPLVMFY